MLILVAYGHKRKAQYPSLEGGPRAFFLHVVMLYPQRGICQQGKMILFILCKKKCTFFCKEWTRSFFLAKRSVLFFCFYELWITQSSFIFSKLYRSVLVPGQKNAQLASKVNLFSWPASRVYLYLSTPFVYVTSHELLKQSRSLDKTHTVDSQKIV